MVLSRAAAHALVPLMVVYLSMPAAGASTTPPIDAIGRLVLNGKFLCTAFVIRSEQLPALPHSERATYRNWLVTAGHCLEQTISRGQPAFLANPSEAGIGDMPHSHPTVTAGFSGGRPWGLDIAVLMFWTSRPVPFLEPAFDYSPRGDDWLVAVGYPRGVLSFVVGGFLGRNEDQQLLVDARVSRGISGAPVLLPGTRKVIGIVVEGTVQQPAEGEQACMLRICGVDRPYKAASIDWLRRIVRW